MIDAGDRQSLLWRQCQQQVMSSKICNVTAFKEATPGGTDAESLSDHCEASFAPVGATVTEKSKRDVLLKGVSADF